MTTFELEQVLTLPFKILYNDFILLKMFNLNKIIFQYYNLLVNIFSNMNKKVLDIF